MKKNLLFSTLAAAFIALASPAHALLLTPGDADFTGADLTPANPTSAAGEQGYVETLFNTSNLTLYYKAEPEGNDSGTFASSYETTFSPNNEPEDALIDYISGAAIACPECYLAVKDGNHDPSYYFFNLANWNGTEDIELEGFWPNGGAISHVSIWGNESEVAEPGSLLLLSLGLTGLAAIRRRRSS
jgi:hypothetical protein